MFGDGCAGGAVPVPAGTTAEVGVEPANRRIRLDWRQGDARRENRGLRADRRAAAAGADAGAAADFATLAPIAANEICCLQRAGATEVSAAVARSQIPESIRHPCGARVTTTTMPARRRMCRVARAAAKPWAGSSIDPCACAPRRGAAGRRHRGAVFTHLDALRMAGREHR